MPSFRSIFWLTIWGIITMMKHHYYKWCYLSRMLSANSWRTARSGMPTRARPAWRGGGSPSRRGGSGRMWSRGAVQRSGDVIDNFHCSADSVSQWQCTTATALQQKSYRVSVSLTTSSLVTHTWLNTSGSLGYTPSTRRRGSGFQTTWITWYCGLLWITRVLTQRGIRGLREQSS